MTPERLAEIKRQNAAFRKHGPLPAVVREELVSALEAERARLDAVIENRWAIHGYAPDGTVRVVADGGYGAHLAEHVDGRAAIDAARGEKGAAR